MEITVNSWGDVLAWLLGTPLEIVLILGLAIVSWLVVRWLIRRTVQRTVARARHDRPAEISPEERMNAQERTAQRARAIGTLLNSAAAVIIWATALLMTLQALNINVAPLLASAGVAGVALGFGAQTLVKDYLAGIFLILEDQYGVGDVIDIDPVNPVVGTVEEVALRYTRLRDLNGVVWYVRNGEIIAVGNRSQGWTLAIADIPVAYDTDLERVHTIVDRVGADMIADPAFQDLLFTAPTYAGVESVSGEAVVVRVTGRAVPDKQIPASRAVRERVKAAFDAEGIRVPIVYRPPAGPPPA